MMNRRRWLWPDFFTSEDMLALDHTTRLMYQGLWLYADDDGKGILDVRMIHANVWGLDGSVSMDDVESMLIVLADRGLIDLYKVRTRDYFVIPTWEEWAKVQNPTPSRLPDPPEPPPRPSGGSHEALHTSAQYRGCRERKEGERAGESVSVGVRESVPEGAVRDPETPPHPRCERHRAEPTDKPCKPCGNARKEFDYWMAMDRVRRVVT